MMIKVKSCCKNIKDTCNKSIFTAAFIFIVHLLFIKYMLFLYFSYYHCNKFHDRSSIYK